MPNSTNVNLSTMHDGSRKGSKSKDQLPLHWVVEPGPSGQQNRLKIFAWARCNIMQLGNEASFDIYLFTQNYPAESGNCPLFWIHQCIKYELSVSQLLVYFKQKYQKTKWTNNLIGAYCDNSSVFISWTRMQSSSIVESTWRALQNITRNRFGKSFWHRVSGRKHV